MFHLVSFGWFLDDQNITSIGLFYKNWGFYLEVYLVGVCFRGGVLTGDNGAGF